jgi:hypothetical protein
VPINYYPNLDADGLLALLDALQKRQTTGLVIQTSAAGLQAIKSFSKGASRNEVELRRVLYSLHLLQPGNYADPYVDRITRTRARYTFSLFLAFASLAFAGCTVVSADRVFPKLTWAWSAEAVRQRESDKAAKEYYELHHSEWQTNSAAAKP